MTDYEATFNLSYWRAVGRKIDGVVFIDGFYARLLSSSMEIAQKFANTDFDRQKEIVLLSLIHVASYYSADSPGEILERLARRHSRNEVNVEPHLYDVWLDTLLKTVEVYDPEYDSIVCESWQRVLTPGIEFMKSKYLE